VSWTLDPASTFPVTIACAINGAAPTQTLSCGPAPATTGAFVLKAGQTITLHVTSPTTTASCGPYPNTASVTTTNDGNPTASATTSVACPVGQITPTNTTCQQFSSGTAGTLSAVTYPTSGTTIGQGVAPGVFFYWTPIKVTSAGLQSYTITESTNYNPTTVPLGSSRYFPFAAGSFAYTPACATLSTTITSDTSNGANPATVTVMFTAPSAGTYFIGIKFTTKSVAGTGPAFTSASQGFYTYQFETNADPTTHASVELIHN
jgi:hypothetical protein